MRKKKQNVSSEPLTEREKQLMKEIAELKDAMSFFRKRPKKIGACSKFEYIFQFKQKNFESQLKKDYSVKQFCKVLTVSETGFYKWKRNRNKPKAWQILLQKIYEILDAHPDNHNYGIDRILLALNQKGEYPSRSTVIRAMKKENLLHESHRSPDGLTKKGQEGRTA